MGARKIREKESRKKGADTEGQAENHKEQEEIRRGAGSKEGSQEEEQVPAP